MAEYYWREVCTTYEQIPLHEPLWFIEPHMLSLTWIEGVPPTIDPAPSPYWKNACDD